MRRKALVDKHHWQPEPSLELACEAPCSRRHVVLGAIGMHGQADDQKRWFPLVDQSADGGEALIVFLCRNGGQGMRQGHRSIADGDSDPSRTKIEGEDAARWSRGRLGRRHRLSRVSDSVGEPRKINAQQLHGGRQARFGGLCKQ